MLWKEMKVKARCVGPFEILERIGELAYRLALPPRLANIHDVFHISMLRKYEPDLLHVLDYEMIEIDDRTSYIDRPVQIIDRKEQVLRNKTISLVKILWQYHGMEEATWESEELIKRQYPYLFQSLGMS